jgi:pimeloyl-ACP methyl ester carboxylesterase
MNLQSNDRPAIVLVHGAWADASSWNAVIRPLQAAGYVVYAPPNPLRGLASDAASVAAFIKTLSGPIILAGHSYGGAVVSVASARSAGVKALVFVDAFVPDAGESCLSLLGAYPAPPKDLFNPVQLDDGMTEMYFNPKYFGSAFANGVDAKDAGVMAVTQRPVTLSALNEEAPSALGWKTLPNWYVHGDLDGAIPPPLKTMMAKRAKAIVTPVHAGHLSMVTHPEVTVSALVTACETAAAST